MWIDSHCHLDAPEFDNDREAVVARARSAGVPQMVLPSVTVAGFQALHDLAHQHRFAYALGIHPLYTSQASDADLTAMEARLSACRDDPQLVAVGEIGLDLFVPGQDVARQTHFYIEQLKLARKYQLPVILHVRRSADLLLAGLRRVGVSGGIAHAFNGSDSQAQRFVDLGFKLGFGGTLTFERSAQIRRLAQQLPASALVLETDAPDIPPQWLYKSAAERAQGVRARNEPCELPRIGASLAELRGWTVAETAAIVRGNTYAALPRLAAWDQARVVQGAA
ncbi:TatD family hydrolase [Roseateles koreensis]|uniref:TatD family hydrolase n=1 Tax=Roseateles koreensis TaxID=2987526 RepID=A0ABT5KWG9_9BURK|nr:TatD family hydrolase [Roseateles koreensis]MDC8787274.1 TatD family hydrolase [Roseateles koreensis]